MARLTTPDTALLDVQDLRVSYSGGVLALQGVSLQVQPGEVVALIGANGAGKTSLLKTIVGLLRPLSGEIQFAGRPLRRVVGPARVRLGLALVPESRRLFGRLTVSENLALGSYIDTDAGRRREMLERVWALFPVLRERAKQRSATLSGGEQQMLAIGRALMSRPKLLMLDEPSLGIMPRLVEQIMDVLRQLHERDGLAMLLVEQNVPAALRLAQRGYVLQTGRVVLEAASHELLKSDLVRRAYLGL